MKPSHLAVTAVAALALAGCSGKTETPTTYTPEPPITAPQSTQADASAPERDTTGTDGASDGAVTATKTVTATAPADPTPVSPSGYMGLGGAFFRTPTGKIFCGVGGQFAGCQVLGTTVVPANANCDRGGTFTRDELSKGYMSENGGPFNPWCFNQGVFNMSADQKTLPYGHSITYNGMTCVSEARGVTCNRGEHGFFVSAQSFSNW